MLYVVFSRIKLQYFNKWTSFYSYVLFHEILRPRTFLKSTTASQFNTILNNVTAGKGNIWKNKSATIAN